MLDSFIKYLHAYVVKSWKTTLVGAVIFIATFLIQEGKITQSQFEVVLAVLSAMGFVISKDGDQTHSSHE
jgi:hypothetical protein